MPVPFVMAGLSAFEQLLHAHAGAGIQKQLRLAERIGEREWELDLAQGRLDFLPREEGGVCFELQVLGTVAKGRWLWTWANPDERLADKFKEAAVALRALGAQFNVEALCSPLVHLGTQSAEQLALVASGASRAVGYFRAPLEHAELYCLLTTPSLPEEELPSAAQVAQVFPRLLEEVALKDERLAFIHFLRFHRMRIEMGANQVRGLGRSGDQIAADFDLKNRLSALRTFGS